jgi:hypothetical protein
MESGQAMLTFEPARHMRANTLDFKPPKPNSLVQKAFQMLIPTICKSVLGGLSVDIDPTSLERLRALKGQRCLLLPNHPSEWDPCVMFDIGRRLNENFFFVAAREVFDYSYGLRGWFFQRLGVYSLVRGSNDRGSFKTSMDILAGNKGRLVIFVEGEISNQNESLLPLESGVIQLAFMALNDVYKDTGKDLSKLPSLHVCPVSIRYAYEDKGLDEAIAQALFELEEAIGLTATQSSRFERLRLVAMSVLNGAAGQFGYEADTDLPLAQKVAGLSDFMLTKLEQIINLPPDESLSYLDRIRRIRNLVDKVMSQSLGEEPPAYQKRLFDHQKAVLKNFYLDLERVVNFVAIYDGYLHPEMSPDRTVEMIRRLEKEVFGAYRLAHPRKGIVRVAEPVDLKTHFEAFLKDKRAIIGEITLDVERKIFEGLQSKAPAQPVAAGLS